MQGGNGAMRYTSSHVDFLSESQQNSPGNPHIIDVAEGVADAQTIRWWSAILAKRKGWEPIVKDGPRDKYVAPWAVSRTCETSFVIRQEAVSQSFTETPLSSDDAFDALLEFARLHGLGSELPIALTIAMCFPMHRYYGTDVKLPSPSTRGGKTSAATSGTLSIWRKLKEDLPYYMTLSCSPEVMVSLLCGSFWQPDVPCNMASQWLHPILEEVLGDLAEHEGQELIAVLGAIRRPSVGALWLEAAVSGIGPALLQRVRGGKPPLDPIAFPWTGARQSFMDDAGSGPYASGDPESISRPDVWRLLHLPPIEEDELSYRYGPMTPWEPCGTSLARNCALRVTSHLQCLRHDYHYDHWKWELANGQAVRDYGFLRRSPALITEEFSILPKIKAVGHSFEKRELDPDREASDEASFETFRWFIFGGEGVPPEEIYQDPLIRAIVEQEDDDGEEPDGAGGPGSKEFARKDKDRVEVWLDTVVPGTPGMASGQMEKQKKIAPTKRPNCRSPRLPT